MCVEDPNSEAVPKPEKEIKVHLVIDTEDDPSLVGQHMDVSVYEIIKGENGDEAKFVGHATVKQKSSPKQIAEVLNFMANVYGVLAKEENDLSEFIHAANVFRAAAKQVPGLNPEQDAKQ